MTLDEFLKQSPRGTAKKLAQLIDVPPSNISMWRKGTQQVPPKKCKQIEKATLGLVTRVELRPDIFK